MRHSTHRFGSSRAGVKYGLGVAGRPFGRLLHAVSGQAERATQLLGRPAHNRGRHFQPQAPGVLERLGVLLEQTGTCPSHFLSGRGRSLPDTRRLLGRSLTETAGLFGSPLAGATGCVFHALCRLFLLAWVCHLCFSADCRLMTCPSSFPSNAIWVGPFPIMPVFSVVLAAVRNDGDMARLCRRLASHLPQFGAATAVARLTECPLLKPFSPSLRVFSFCW